MNYFFVDYENVHAGGISNDLSMLKDGDVVCVMFSQNCKNVTFDVIEAISRRGAKLEALSAGTGAKNALDFQLSSYLGYVIGKTSAGKDNRFYIVSKDTGYDRICTFWASRGVLVERIVNLAGDLISAADAASVKPSKPASKKKKKSQEPDKSDIAEYIDALEEAEPITEEEAIEVLDELTGAIPKKTAAKTKAKTSASPKAGKKKVEDETKKVTSSKPKVADDDLATEEEMRKYLSEDEYSADILSVFNNYKTKQAINNALNKLLKSSQKSSVIYKKLKPLIKEKHKN